MTNNRNRGVGKSRFGKRGGGAPQQPVETDAGEKRAAPRQAVYRNAEVILSDGSAIECVAKNVSGKGCKIVGAGVENLPDEIQFRLEAGGALRMAAVRWREHGEAGVEFVKA